MKWALVTGGSGNIGSAICKRLAEDGLHVLVHANRNPEKAQTVVDQIRQQGGIAEPIVFDVTDAKAVLKTMGEVVSKHPIQVIVSNAGTHQDMPMAGMTELAWKKVLDVSLNGFFNVTQPLLLPMMAKRWGRVIALSSVAGITGNRGQANYAAAKSGLHGAIKSLAIELASRGVTANVVAPGIIAGEMSESSFDQGKIKQLVPMQRTGTPQEVAALVSFLASEESAYVSGQVISINGAMI